MINTEGDERYDIICNTVTDTVKLTLRLMGRYKVTSVVGVDAYGGIEGVKEYAEENRLDNIIFGKAYRGEEGDMVFEMSVYDRGEGEVTITEEERAGSIFEIFGAADALVVSLVEEFSGMHVGFGTVELENTGEEGDFEVYIDGVFVIGNDFKIENVFNGKRTVEVRQKRMLKEEVIFKREVEIYEEKVVRVYFHIPYLLDEEEEILKTIDAAIKGALKNKTEIGKVENSFKEVLSLLEDVSYSKGLVEKKNYYKQLEVEYKLQANRWKIEDDFYYIKQDIYDELVGIYNKADSFLYPKLIRGKVLENANLLYHLMGIEAAYNFSQSMWEEGVNIYIQIESFSNKLPAKDYYQFKDEKEYVYRVYEGYLNKNGKLAEEYINEKLTEYLGNKLEASKKIFSEYDTITESELIILTNPTGMNVRVNEKYYGKSPVRIKGLEQESVPITIEDSWFGGTSRYTYLSEERNLIFVKKSIEQAFAAKIINDPAKTIRKNVYDLAWTQIEGVYSYIVQIYGEEGGVKEVVYEISDIKKNKYTFGRKLEEGKDYSYRVCAVNENGIRSDWSNEKQFIEGMVKVVETKENAPSYSVTKPPDRYAHAMVYLKDSNKIIMFGGNSHGNNGLNDTWEYDIENNTWSEISVSGDKPRARWHHAMAYLGGTKIVLFGGGTDVRTFNDTWEYDAANHSWTKITRVKKPSTRKAHAMEYIGGSKVILFGGVVNMNNETWEYDGTSHRWKRKSKVIGRKPRARYGHDQMVYHEDSNKIIMFGGTSDAQGAGTNDYRIQMNDTWEYDVTNYTWKEIKVSGSKPGIREHIAMAYAGNNKIILHGGTYYPDGKKQGGIGQIVLDDLWEYDISSQTWTEINPIGYKPRYLGAHSMVYIGDNKVVMYSGHDTWIFDASTHTWYPQHY